MKYELVYHPDDRQSWIMATSRKGIEWQAIGMFALIVLVIAAWVLLS